VSVTPRTVDLFREAREARQAAQQQHLADVRRNLARLPSLGVSAGVAVTENAGSNMAPITAALPAAARIASGGGGNRVLNPKIWEEDTKRFAGPKLNVGAWITESSDVVRKKRELGDVEARTIIRVCEGLATGDPDANGTAKRRMTFAFIAGFVPCTVETARKAVRWLEKAYLIDTFNVLWREARGVFRAANMYLLRMPDAPTAVESTETPAAELSVVARLSMRLERWKASFGLQARAWGLNATAVSWQNLRKERASEPA
jgi:hypothetical protein